MESESKILLSDASFNLTSEGAVIAYQADGGEIKGKPFGESFVNVYEGERLIFVGRLLTGWINYFLLADMERRMRDLWQWVKGRIRVIIYKKWKTPKRREEALLKCWEIRKRAEGLSGWRITDWGMKRNARGVANQGNHYARIARSGTFAHFVSDFLLELGGLMNPLKHYLERRKAPC